MEAFMKNSRTGLKTIIFIAAAVFIINFTGADAFAAGKSTDCNVYKGGWFNIEYPYYLTAKPSMMSQSNPGTYDSAFFVSYDEKVEFYIFSPQWNGEAKDIEVNKKTENASPAQVQKKDGREITNYTITAKDGSYTRTYQQTVEKGSKKWVIGLKYKTLEDENMYNMHNADYLNFKRSLKQFSAKGNGITWNIFKGGWFNIEYPTDFTVRPSIISPTNNGTYDSAFFTSPDNKVEFYMFSPQWSYDAKDIAINEKTETASPAEVQKKDGREITNYTITAKDGSYTRTYQQTVENEGSTKWVIGLKYATQKDYDKYKAAYLKFKGSLKQFAD